MHIGKSKRTVVRRISQLTADSNNTDVIWMCIMLFTSVKCLKTSWGHLNMVKACSNGPQDWYM